MPELILLTGAAGQLAAILRPALTAAGYSVRLTDEVSAAPLRGNEHETPGRLESSSDMARACEGATTLIHLGAAAKDVGWPELTRSNLVGLITLFEAARAGGVSRIVFASTMHVLGMHERIQPLDEGSPIAPDSRYAVTKVFGEAACQLFAEKYGIPVTVVRIGHVVKDVADAAPGQGVASSDLASILLLALSTRHSGRRVFHAVAPHDGYPLTDGRLARDHSFSFEQKGPDRSEIFTRLESLDWLGERGRRHHGGSFAQEDAVMRPRRREWPQFLLRLRRRLWPV